MQNKQFKLKAVKIAYQKIKLFIPNIPFLASNHH